LRVRLDQVVVGSTDAAGADERCFETHERLSAPDERFAYRGYMVIFFVFLLGIGNFALHRAVLGSGHPALAQLKWLAGAMAGRASLLLEFALLFVALLLAAGGHPGWAWAYLGYSVLNGVAAWLILSRRI
jgi:hypothetical protein